MIEGSPEPPARLEVLETDPQHPLAAYAQACDAWRPNHQSTRYVNWWL
jgi:hypothetical protein